MNDVLTWIIIFAFGGAVVHVATVIIKTFFPGGYSPDYGPPRPWPGPPPRPKPTFPDEEIFRVDFSLKSFEVDEVWNAGDYLSRTIKKISVHQHGPSVFKVRLDLGDSTAVVILSGPIDVCYKPTLKEVINDERTEAETEGREEATGPAPSTTGKRETVKFRVDCDGCGPSEDDDKDEVVDDREGCEFWDEGECTEPDTQLLRQDMANAAPEGFKVFAAQEPQARGESDNRMT